MLGGILQQLEAQNRGISGPKDGHVPTKTFFHKNIHIKGSETMNHPKWV